MNKKVFIKKHVKEFFKMSGIKETELDLDNVLDYLCTILNAETPHSNNINYFEKSYIHMKLRKDEVIEQTVEYVRKSDEGLVIAAKGDGYEV